MNDDRQWQSLLKRLQAVAREDGKYKGAAVLSVRMVLVGGELRGWATPILTAYEPREDSDAILAALDKVT